MPELPEVETVVTSLEDKIVDKKIKRVQIREEDLLAGVEPVEFKEVVAGSQILAVRRRGKYIIIKLDTDYWLVTHFG